MLHQAIIKYICFFLHGFHTNGKKIFLINVNEYFNKEK